MKTVCSCHIVSLLACLLSSGCGQAEYEVTPVSGQVTLDGEPLAGVGVSFVPTAEDRNRPIVGPGSIGKTGPDGRFSLTTVKNEPGAVPAVHVVRMSIATTSGEKPSVADESPEGITTEPAATSPKPVLPLIARDGTLRFTVSAEGTDRANFDLTSD